MNPQWLPMQSNDKQNYQLSQQSMNQGFIQFQQNFPCMWQQQSQFIFPNNVIANQQKPNYDNNSFGQYQWQSIPSGKVEENNKINYERNPNQQQYALYPRDAIYHHASGPGWQQQQVFYPANVFK